MTTQTKGFVKLCPHCGKPLILVGNKVGPISKYHWTCTLCLYMVDYQSEEARKLREVEIK